MDPQDGESSLPHRYFDLTRTLECLDLNTLFLFGEPIGMLSGSPLPHAEGFLEAFQAGFKGCGMRIGLGPLRVFMPKGKWLKACKKTHDFADVYVDKALEYREKHDFLKEEPPLKGNALYYTTWRYKRAIEWCCET
jgi:hypothetical protein